MATIQATAVEGFERSLAQLVVEAGFAGINYGLTKDVRTILDALPDWLDDPEILASCQALVLFLGLDRPKAAARVLAKAPATACSIPLRQLLGKLR